MAANIPTATPSILMTNARTVIDPGSSYRRLKRLGEQGKVDTVIFSHYHEDPYPVRQIVSGLGISNPPGRSFGSADRGRTHGEIRRQ